MRRREHTYYIATHSHLRVAVLSSGNHSDPEVYRRQRFVEVWSPRCQKKKSLGINGRIPTTGISRFQVRTLYQILYEPRFLNFLDLTAVDKPKKSDASE
jgi:hypothetical protein